MDVDEEGCFRPSMREDDFCPAGSFTRETVRDLDFSQLLGTIVNVVDDVFVAGLVVAGIGRDGHRRAGQGVRVSLIVLRLGGDFLCRVDRDWGGDLSGVGRCCGTELRSVGGVGRDRGGEHSGGDWRWWRWRWRW